MFLNSNLILQPAPDCLGSSCYYLATTRHKARLTMADKPRPSYLDKIALNLRSVDATTFDALSDAYDMVTPMAVPEYRPFGPMLNCTPKLVAAWYIALSCAVANYVTVESRASLNDGRLVGEARVIFLINF